MCSFDAHKRLFSKTYINNIYRPKRSNSSIYAQYVLPAVSVNCQE